MAHCERLSASASGTIYISIYTLYTILNMCPHTTIHVSSYYYMCPHTTICTMCACPHTAISVLHMVDSCGRDWARARARRYTYYLWPGATHYMCLYALLREPYESLKRALIAPVTERVGTHTTCDLVLLYTYTLIVYILHTTRRYTYYVWPGATHYMCLYALCERERVSFLFCVSIYVVKWEWSVVILLFFCFVVLLVLLYTYTLIVYILHTTVYLYT